MVKNPFVNARRHKGYGVQSLGWEDPFDKGMATHSNTIAWRIPWTEEPGGQQSISDLALMHVQD